MLKIFRLFLFSIGFLIVCTGLGQTIEFPDPSSNTHLLFYLQRPVNTNTVIYALNLVNEVPDQENPIHIYWINYAKNAKQEELTDLERKYAYGIKLNKIAENEFEFYLVSYKKMKLLLKQGNDKQFHVFGDINNKQLIIERIYLAVKGGSLFKPRIDYVEIRGVDVNTGVVVEERIKL
jgi:predicted small secreted protein